MNEHRITTAERLESLYSQPALTTMAKDFAKLNEYYRKLIESSPYVSIVSAGEEGLDCSPRREGETSGDSHYCAN